MHLFWPSSSGSVVEFLQILCASSFFDFDVQDQHGTTALHRATYWGTAEDVRVLLKIGVSPSIPDKDQGWTPAFYAVYANNTTTLRSLASHMPPNFAQTVDRRGRSILHVAIETEEPENIRLALELGADPYHILRDTTTGDGKITSEITPVELARLQGLKKHMMFLHALHSAGFDSSIFGDGESFEKSFPAS